MPVCSLCLQAVSFKFSKNSSSGEAYSIYSCSVCRQWQLFPVPKSNELKKLYQGIYFEERKDRGYPNYESPEVKKSILQTAQKNLKALGFYEWEKKISESNGQKRALEVGCASGHFVEYLQNRGWFSEGIDTSRKMVGMAQKKGLKVCEEDFSQEHIPKKFSESYHLITLWASLEHFAEPEKFINNFFKLLKPEGRLYISTCHLGFWAKIKGQHWRYLNVPEHVWFFSRNSLKKWLGNFFLKQSFTYGSGFTQKEGARLHYRLIKKIADFSARYFYLGDMIVCDFRKKRKG